MSQATPCSSPTTTITALRLAHEITLDARHPDPAWAKATPVVFCADWRGNNADPARQTEVRALWTPQTLYLHFDCHYRELFVFEDSDPNGRRDHLWDRDVAEAFLQPDPSQPHHYKEFEVSPNAQWIDLDIGPSNSEREEPPRDLKSGLVRSVYLDKERSIWEAELAIPMRALTTSFNPKTAWRANFFRVEGRREPRFYSAWQPTKTAEPNFHVPEVFGYLKFIEK
ncbi:MAG TPA: carbohydrate-binding family 9-like protein [Terriglobales bacterium]|nr:carbohydrate-binding family 9-like protein [Terriglobales bacterium]